MTNSKIFEKAKLLFQKGLINLQKEKYEDAELDFEESLELFPNRLSTLQNLITIYSATKQKEKLKKILDKHKHLSNEKEFLYGVAYNYHFNEDYSKSIKICIDLTKFKELKNAMLDLLASNYKKTKIFFRRFKNI